jgi:DNA-binding transcriptional ArsR family regulator
MYVYAKIKTKKMVLAKTELFEEELQAKANLFKALAHPARLQILEYLVQSRTCLSGDISDVFPLTRTTLNQHMKELKDAGLVCGHMEGSKIVYCLNCEKIKEMSNILSGFVKDFQLPHDFCCQ